MSMISEFKDFAMRGNVVDMAVGIVIGGAFGKIVSSFVADVLMPPIGLMLGGVDFSDLAITLSAATADAEAVLLKYGVFIQTLPTQSYAAVFLQTIVDFLIIAFAIFLVVKAMNSVMKEEEAPEAPPAPPEPSKEEVLLTEIRERYGQVRIRPGDVIRSAVRIVEYFEREGRMGHMLYTTLANEWHNQAGEWLRTTESVFVRY